MTQFLGGYLADKIGGDIILPIVAVFWSMITFWTPQLVYLSTDKYLTIQIIIISRVFLGMFQGNVFILLKGKSFSILGHLNHSVYCNPCLSVIMRHPLLTSEHFLLGKFSTIVTRIGALLL